MVRLLRPLCPVDSEMLSAKRALPAVLWAVGVALRLSDEGDGKIPRQDRGIYLQAEECPFEENSFIISPKNFRWDDKKGRAIASCSSCFPTDPSASVVCLPECYFPYSRSQEDNNTGSIEDVLWEGPKREREKNSEKLGLRERCEERERETIGSSGVFNLSLFGSSVNQRQKKKPLFLVALGPPGSGKSSMVSKLPCMSDIKGGEGEGPLEWREGRLSLPGIEPIQRVNFGPANTVTIDIDALFQSLPQFQRLSASIKDACGPDRCDCNTYTREQMLQKAYTTFRFFSDQVNDQKLYTSMLSGFNIMWETLGFTPGAATSYAKRAKSWGFSTEIITPFAFPDQTLQRLAARAEKNGQIALPAETVAPVYAAVSKTTAAFLRFRGGSEPDVNELGSVETVLVVDNTREKTTPRVPLVARQCEESFDLSGNVNSLCTITCNTARLCGGSGGTSVTFAERLQNSMREMTDYGCSLGECQKGKCEKNAMESVFEDCCDPSWRENKCAERVRFKTSAIPLLESTASSYESNESDGGGVANLQSFYWVASRYALSPSSSEPPGPTLEGKIESAVTIREPRPARVVFGRACAEGSRLWGTPFQGVSLSDSMKAEFAELSALRFSSLSHDSPFSCLLQATDAALPGGEEGNTRDSERERASHVSRPLEALRSALCVPKSTGGSSEGPRLCLAPIPQFQKSADSGDGLGASPEEKDHKSFASWIEQVLAARRMKVSRGHTEKGTLSHRLSGLRDILRRSGRRIWKFRFGLTRLFALPSRSEESEETEGQILGRLEEEEEASAQEGSRGSGEVGSLPLGWHWSVGLLPVSVSEGTSTSGVWEQNAADVILEVCAHALGVPSCLDWEMRTSAEGTSEKKGNRGPSPQSLALKGSHLSVALDPLHSELSEQTERRSASTWGAVLGGRGGTLLPSRTALFADSRKAVEMYTRRGVAECGNL